MNSPSANVHRSLINREEIQTLLIQPNPNPHAVYKQIGSRIQERLRDQFKAGRDVNDLIQARTKAIDTLLCSAWENFGAVCQEAATLVAVGGFGRAELHPHSDIDLLILVETPPERALANALEGFITSLWDMKLDIGHSVRTISECVEEARKDITVMTNLLESRWLAGNALLYQRLREVTSSERMWPAREFFTAKVREQNERYRRNGGTAYNLEPNVKEGIGGLRDIHTIAWIAKRHYNTQQLSDLATHGLLTENEYKTLTESQSYLWKVRAVLHVITDKHEDRLLFEHQREVAKHLGFEDSEPHLGVELFMKEYYRTIMELARLNEMLLGLFREMFWENPNTANIVNLNRRFQTRNGYLEVTSDSVFTRYPFALLEIFLLLQQHEDIKGVRPSTIRLVRDHRYLINNDFRDDIGCRSLFLEIIRQPRGQTHEFRRMHTYGILAAYLPVFEKIVGLMQFDLFHAYTVDEHTLFVVRNVRKLMVPEHYHELPHCSDIITRIPKPELLYLAGLFHDIAKGRGGNHSTLGAEEALSFCHHHSIGEYDANLVAWLVIHHLIMSTTAQRQDISDPDVVRRFATAVGTPVRLDYLYLLTVADIRATNPDLWNSWKDSLLFDLYNATRRALRHGLDTPKASDEMAFECREEALAQLADVGLEAARITALWENLDPDYFVRTHPEQVMWHTQEIIERFTPNTPLVSLRRWRANNEVFIYSPNREYLFAAITSLLERLGLTILEARLFTTANHTTLGSYIVLEANGEAIEGDVREEEITQSVSHGLQLPKQSIYSPKHNPRRQLRSFPITTRIAFEEDNLRHCTIIEVVCSDRPGLLSRVGWALTACQGSLQNAKIATFGERVDDVFYVVDENDGGPLTPHQQEVFKEKLLQALESEHKRLPT